LLSGLVGGGAALLALGGSLRLFLSGGSFLGRGLRVFGVVLFGGFTGGLFLAGGFVG